MPDGVCLSIVSRRPDLSDIYVVVPTTTYFSEGSFSSGKFP